MAQKIIKTIFQIRRDTAANWLLNKDVIPAAGEPCFEIDTGVFKIGNGTTTYENLPVIAGNVAVEISADGKSIIADEGILKLAGFDAAEVGAQPYKTADGSIEWVVPSTESVDGLQKIVSGLQKDVVGLQEIVTPSGEGAVALDKRVESLEEIVNGTGEGSVAQIISAEVTAQIDNFVSKVSGDGVVNTFKELVDYVATHDDVVNSIVTDITTLQTLVGKSPVADQITNAISASETKIAALFEHVKYEISSKPVGTLVDYREKEIRVMCPADTTWTLQNSGEGADASVYYIGFKAYAPNDSVVSFKEDLAEVIADDTMYYFEGNDFAGIDAYGRKYSIVWLPVARYNEATKTWSYYGVNSSASRYIGWYYSVEWYDADGKVISSDTIRINLSNESCHNAVEPYFMGSVVKGVKVGGTLLDIVEGKVDIPVGAGLKGSGEVTVAADGTLGVGEININKIVQSEGDSLVLDGGSSTIS